MATSGTRTFSLDAATAIEEAFELAGLELRTGYDALAARRSLIFYLLIGLIEVFNFGKLPK
jgi:hypothetical protein